MERPQQFAGDRAHRKPPQFGMIDLLAGVAIVGITMGSAVALRDYMPRTPREWFWLWLPFNQFLLPHLISIMAGLLACFSALRRFAALAYGWLAVSIMAAGVVVTLGQISS